MSVLPLTDQERMKEQQLIVEHVARYVLYAIQQRKEIARLSSLSRRAILEYAHAHGVNLPDYKASKYQVIHSYATAYRSMHMNESAAILSSNGIDIICIDRIVEEHAHE